MKLLTSDLAHAELAGTWMTGGRTPVAAVADVLTADTIMDKIGYTIETNPAMVDTETATNLTARLREALANHDPEMSDDDLLANIGLVPTGKFTHFSRDYVSGVKTIIAEAMSSRHVVANPEMFFDWVKTVTDDTIMTAAVLFNGRNVHATGKIPGNLPVFHGVKSGIVTFTTSYDGSVTNQAFATAILTKSNIPVRILNAPGWTFKNTTNSIAKIDNIVAEWSSLRESFDNFQAEIEVMVSTPFDFNRLVAYLMKGESTRSENDAARLHYVYSKQDHPNTVFAAMAALTQFDVEQRTTKSTGDGGAAQARIERTYTNMVGTSWVAKGRRYIEHNCGQLPKDFRISF